MKIEIKKIAKVDLERFESIQDEMIKMAIAQKEETIKKVISMVLGREVTFEDVKDFSFVYNENQPGKEYFAYKGEIVGEFQRGFVTDTETLATKWTETFIPIEK